MSYDDEDGGTQDLRGLVMSGGKPFILITVEDPETGEVSLTHGGLGPEADLPAALQEIALLIAEGEG